MELKVGMYIRTKDGLIDKVIIDYKGCCNSPICNCKHVSCEHDYYDEENIIKASDNLIDLIEVGDYVNGCKITCISDIEEPRYLNRLLFSEIDGGDDIGMQVFDSKNIKSIVTKEQFESMKYEVNKDE